MSICRIAAVGFLTFLCVVGSSNAAVGGGVSSRSVIYNNAGLMSPTRFSRRSTRRSSGGRAGAFGLPEQPTHAGIVDKELDAPHLMEVQQCSVREYDNWHISYLEDDVRCFGSNPLIRY